jgi:hypothetical protein
LGFSISWAGVERGKREALDLLRLEDTGVEDEANEAPLSAAETGLGWTIIWSNDIMFGGDEPRFSRLSNVAPILVCLIEEHTMFSLAMLFREGETKWSISHEGDGDDVFDLKKAGELPPFASEIETELTNRQKKEGGRSAAVDYMFDIPLMIAKRLTGFKHDEIGPAFTVVRSK